MEGGSLSLVGVAFLLMGLWRAVRVRRDLARGETHFETALGGSGRPVLYHRTPVRFWCAILVHAGIAILFALVGAIAFRAIALARR
jgi:hypothetical protein